MHSYSVLYSMTALLGAVSASKGVGFGSGWALWSPKPSEGGPTVVKVQTTLTVPELPDPLQDSIILWPGINTAGGSKGAGLVQVITAAYTEPNRLAGCSKVEKGEWLSRASFYEIPTNHQEIGDCVGVKKGDKLAMTYTYNKDKDSYDQTLLVNDKKASTWTSSGYGPGYNFYISTECQDKWHGDSMEHEYTNTTITLDKEYKEYSKYLKKEHSTDTGFKSDDGKVWTADKITIQSSPCTPATS